MLLSVQSIRSGNFEIFVSWTSLHRGCLSLIIRTMFVIYLYLCGHWKRYPNVYQRFLKGRCSTQKEIRKFSKVSDDHAHEQNNNIVKGTGRAIGIYDSPIALAKWMIASPKITRMLENFEESFNDEVKGNEEARHLEKTASFEKMFRKYFEALKKEFSRVGNPFEDHTKQIYTIVSRNIMVDSSSHSVYSPSCLGQEQYHQYTTDVFVLGNKSIYDTIK